MKIISEKRIKVQPHKSIYRKLGRSSHGFNESISEFVDNSIDAMTDTQGSGREKLEININLIYRKQLVDKQYVTIRDNANGMKESIATKAIILAESEKGEENLGQYGFGLKTAALSIGKTFTISTGVEGEKNAVFLEFDEEKWETDATQTWDSYPCKIIEKPQKDHGTNIEIKNLKIKLTDTKLQSLFRDLSRRYRTYIEKGNVVIKVNTVMCVPEKIKWSAGHPNKFEINTKFGKVYGIIGLMTESSQKGLYGIDLFKGNRLIQPYAKFGFQEHPTIATVMGELHMNFVPVTHEKNKFIEDSEKYEEVEKACKESDIFKKIIREARKTQVERGIDEKIKEKARGWEDNIAQAYRDPELKDMINPTVTGKGNEEDNRDGKEKEKKVVEERNRLEEHIKVITKEPEEHRERKPKKTHEVIRHVVTILGKTFKFRHEWINSPGAGRKDYKIEDDSTVVIFTNTSFPAFSATKDKPFYAAINIVEIIAELYAKDGGFGIDKMNEAKDLALKKASEIKNQIDEEKRPKNIRNEALDV